MPAAFMNARATAWSVLMLLLGSILTLAIGLGTARAAELPPPAALQTALGIAPVTADVLEPHLAREGRMPPVRYRGYDARVVLDHVLGRHWRDGEQDVLFRALDGYVSRISTQRLLKDRAWLVFAKADGGPFVVDNLHQGERHVPLGPYYLVWDNRESPVLQAEGAVLWPYQVAHIELGPSLQRALQPPGLDARHLKAAQWAERHCASCHRIRGVGGDKMVVDLTLIARRLDPAQWNQWLLSPTTVRPGTSMPPLAPSRPSAERGQLAKELRDYLLALPPTTPRVPQSEPAGSP